VSRYTRLAERAADLRAQGLQRTLQPLFPTGPTTAEIDGRELIVFSSNDYLSLAGHIRRAWRGAGAGSSRLIAGDRNTHHVLEEALEERWHQPALVFPSGYHANLAVMTTLFEAGDRVGSDALNHASIIDGLRLSRAETVVLPHGAPPTEPLRAAVVEGLYSMDGDQLRLDEYAHPDRWLVVDEAHAVGVLGPSGRGASFEQGVVPDVVIGTFGKAFGAAGAFVIGPPELKELLISKGRSFVYTTGLAEPAARAALAGLEAATEGRRQRLRANVRRFRKGLSQLGRFPPGKDHIIPLVLGERTMEAAGRLAEAGVWVPGIRWPTVERGQERLRFSLAAGHTDDQIDRTLDALDAVL
jgi:7-keto-8-aminopelargonate synthetase-like enzyme